MKFLFSQIGVMTAGGAFTLKKSTIEELPLIEIQEKEQLPFITLVDQILEAKKQNNDSSELEKQIDTMVYKLYDLTDEEIKIIQRNEK